MGEPDAPGLDEINRRLAEIDAALDGEARHPSAEQYELLRERDALRAQAARYRSGRDSGRHSTKLRAELEALRRRLNDEVSARTGYATSMGGGNNSPSPGAWVKLAAQSRAGSDMARLSVRIAEIESELERRASAE